MGGQSEFWYLFSWMIIHDWIYICDSHIFMHNWAPDHEELTVDILPWSAISGQPGICSLLT